jgi:integrase
MGKGFAEAKIIGHHMPLIMARLKEYAECKPIFERDLAFVETASQTGLRISEVAHLRKEEILADSLIVTRRKKKILMARPIPVNPEGLKRIRQWAERVQSGFIFPGAAGPCLIHRRPKFEQENCPECNETVAPLSMVKKKGDRISLFFRHLSMDHKWKLPQVQKWIADSSTQQTDTFCPGGHVSIRAFSKRWQNLMKDLKIYVKGRGVHSVRHASITRVYNSTRDIMVAKEFAGHESLEMTKNYTHIELKEKVSQLPVDW